jgi:MFS family permease
MRQRFFNYENGLLTLLSITFGLVFIDRFALVYLSPYLARDLQLNNTQLGMLVAALSLAWAVSGYFTTAWAEGNDRKKAVFLVCVALFSLASITSGLAGGFIALLLCRLLMGLFEGPTLPLIQSFVLKESSPSRMGLNLGILQSFGSTLFGFLIAPVLLVALADRYGWRSTFFMTGIPGLVMALLGWRLIKPTTAASAKRKPASPERNNDASLSFGELWQFKNIRVGLALACLLLTWLNACMTFMPRYFTEVQRFTEAEMGRTMGLMGLSSLVSGVIVTGLSDRWGRKPVVVLFVLIGIFFPLAIIYLPGLSWQLPAMFLANFMFGTFPIILGVMPSETVPAHSTAKAIGLLSGAGELFGGVFIPFLCGLLADKFGLHAPFYVSAGAALIALLLSFSLVETRPKEVAQH